MADTKLQTQKCMRGLRYRYSRVQILSATVELQKICTQNAKFALKMHEIAFRDPGEVPLEIENPLKFPLQSESAVLCKWTLSKQG